MISTVTLTPPLTLGGADEVVGVMFVGGGMLVWLAWIISGNVRRALEAKYREESRREIAAYVAEGSISPDDARKILDDAAQKETFETELARGLKWGSISAKNAERLLRTHQSRSDAAREAAARANAPA